MTNKETGKRKPFVVGTSNVRIPLEKWNRPELEDQFHALYNRNLELAQQNTSLEKSIKNLNGQLKRFAGRSTNKNEEWELERRDLERKNHLLSQKLKSLKHQLLVYTRPTAHSATINYLTSRNTTTGRPKSALAQSTRPTESSITHQRQFLLVPNADHQIPIDYPKRPSTSTGFASGSKLLQDISDKTALIRLNRELRDFKEQAEVLSFESEQRKMKLDKLQTAYDNLEEELANTRQILKDHEESTKHLRADVLRSTETSHTSAQIAERELRLLRDEVKLLRSNNEKLEASVFEKESSGNSTITEVGRLKAHVQELEASLHELENQRRLLEEQKANAEAERSKISSKYKKLRSSLEKLQNGHQMPPLPPQLDQTKQQSLPEKPKEVTKETKKSQQKEKKRVTERKDPVSGTSILDRLFDDVVSIVDSHLARSSNGTDTELDDYQNGNIKWQQVYEQMYTELEKIRNMLITEYEMNKELVEEKTRLNREAERQFERYEAEIKELKSKIEKYRKEIEILENQLRSIAGGTKIENGTTELISLGPSDTDVTLSFTKLLVTDAGLKLTSTATPTLFLLLEFFDFEFQITPLIQGPETRFHYSTAYEIVVSDLFVHYLETDGINVEVYEVQGTTHEKWGTGRISLKSLLTSKTPTKINGQLDVKGNKSDATVTVLDYSLDVPFQLMKALQAQKRRKTAASYIPVEGDNLIDYNTLIIQVHRCTNLDKLTENARQLPTVYVAYELYDLPVHSTKTIQSNANPEFNDSRSWILPIGQPLHGYLKAQDLNILLINDDQPETTTPLTTLSVPLFPLARNQRITRTFPLSKTDGTVTDATMDVSIYWKHAYTFNDDNLEIKEQKSTTQHVDEKPKTSLEQPYRDVIDLTPKHQPQKPAQNLSANAAAKPPLPKIPATQESVSSLSDESETPRAQIKSSESSSEEAESIILIESPDLNKKEEKPLMPFKNRPAPPPPIEVIKTVEAPKPPELNTSEPKVPEPKPRNRAVDAAELERRLSQELITSTINKRGPEYDPDLEDAPLSIVPPAEFEAVEDEKSEIDIETPSPASYHSSAESTNTYTQEQPSDELHRPKILELPEDLESEKEEETKPKKEAPQPARRSLLGSLPPLKQQPPQPIPAQRRQSNTASSRAVEFHEPLHTSIPPSETSSFADNMSEDSTERDESRRRPQRPARSQPSLNSPSTPPAIRSRPSISAISDKGEEPLSDAIVKISILRIQLLDHSTLLATEYDNSMCYVEWSFLDFERELCETPQSIQLPRDSQQTMDFMTENVYELNWRRIALLRQWMSLGTKLKLVLVLDPGETQDQQSNSGDNMDDIAEAAFDLQEVIDSTHHVISLYDVDMEPVANLELSIEYSDELWSYFEELTALTTANTD
ncbi:C2 domain-containing protein [Aphelenchoides bicaudatus]|nr:C2 domain-containing protein [Aphelenchoides bicaudatus]